MHDDDNVHVDKDEDKDGDDNDDDDEENNDSRVDTIMLDGNTMGQNRKKHSINSHLNIHFPTTSGVSKVSKRASE